MFSFGVGGMRSEKHFFEVVDDGLGRDVAEAVVVAVSAPLLPKDAARSAFKVELYDVVGRLSVTKESGKRVCGTPDADDGRRRERCNMHVSGVHREHDVEVTHENELLLHGLEMTANEDALWVAFDPFSKELILLLTSPKKEDARLGESADGLFDGLLHEMWRIGLADVCGYWCDAYPLLT